MSIRRWIPNLEMNSNFCCVSCMIFYVSLCLKHYCQCFKACVLFVPVGCPCWNLHQTAVSVDHFQFNRFALNFTFTFLNRFKVDWRALSHWKSKSLSGLNCSCECLVFLCALNVPHIELASLSLFYWNNWREAQSMPCDVGRFYWQHSNAKFKTTSGSHGLDDFENLKRKFPRLLERLTG